MPNAACTFGTSRKPLPPASKLLELLALPQIAGRYNDFRDDDANGFWSGEQV